MRSPLRPTRLAALLLALGFAAGVQAEALPAVVDKVLLQQPSVRSAQALLRAADAQITQARSDFLPSVGLSYRNADSRDETQGRPIDRNIRRSDASLRWNLFNGGADTARVQAGGLYRDAAEADLDNVLSRSATRSPRPTPTSCACARPLTASAPPWPARSGSRPAWPAAWTLAASRRPNST